jgi:hypothetical protein
VPITRTVALQQRAPPQPLPSPTHNNSEPHSFYIWLSAFFQKCAAAADMLLMLLLLGMRGDGDETYQLMSRSQK